jgi:hypothetical protein
MNCSVCKSGRINFFKKVDGYIYYECSDCKVISIDSSIIKGIDNGSNIRKFDKTYWDNELIAAKERAYGACLARMGGYLLLADTYEHISRYRNWTRVFS